MQEIITIGSALTDIFVQSSQFEVAHHLDGVKLCQMYGEKLEAESLVVATGGGGGNAAVGFARAGYSVAVVSEVGSDVFGTMIIEEFHKEFVSTNYVVQEKKEQTGGSVILVGKDGGRTVLVHRGAAAQLDPQDIPQRVLKTAKWVHLSSIAGNLETLRTIGKCMTESRTKLSWNPGKRELDLLKEGTLQLHEIPVEVLLLNMQEWEQIASLHEDFKLQIPEIIVTNGHSEGVAFIKSLQGSPLKFLPKRVTVVDETGAGDGFAVGYVVARLQEKSPEQAIGWGQKNAASIITKFGAKPGLLTKAELEQIS